MILRLLGALLILVGCTGFGFMMAANHRREERALKQLLQALDLMECELQYRLSSLPELCMAAAENAGGIVSNILTEFSGLIETQRYSDPAACMEKALSEFRSVPECTKKLLSMLGRSVGRFDLEGQLKGLKSVKKQCADMLEKFLTDRDTRIRNYQTLGLCTGAALAILLI